MKTFKDIISEKLLKDSDDMIYELNKIWRMFQQYSFDFKSKAIPHAFKEESPSNQKRIVVFHIMKTIGYEKMPLVQSAEFKKVLHKIFLDNEINDISDKKQASIKANEEMKKYLRGFEKLVKDKEVEGIENFIDG